MPLPSVQSSSQSTLLPVPKRSSARSVNCAYFRRSGWRSTTFISQLVVGEMMKAALKIEDTISRKNRAFTSRQAPRMPPSRESASKLFFQLFSNRVFHVERLTDQHRRFGAVKRVVMQPVDTVGQQILALANRVFDSRRMNTLRIGFKGFELK